MILSRRSSFLLLKIIVSAGLVVWILTAADLSAIPSALKQTSPFYVLQGLLWMALGILVRSYKWHLLLRVQCSDIPLSGVLNRNIISMFFNNFFLGTLGGDAFRAVSTAGPSQSVGQAASSVIMDRLIGIFAALLLIFPLSFVLLWDVNSLVSLPLLGVFALFGVLITAAFFLLLSKSSARLVSIVAGKIPALKNFAQNLCASSHIYSSHRLILVYSILLSLLYYCGQGITLYCFALAVSAKVSFLHILFISVLVGLLVMIPISLNGLGIQEGSYALYLARIGVAEPAALVIVILSRAAVLAFSLLGGILFACLPQNRKSRHALIAASGTNTAARPLS